MQKIAKQEKKLENEKKILYQELSQKTQHQWELTNKNDNLSLQVQELHKEKCQSFSKVTDSAERVFPLKTSGEQPQSTCSKVTERKPASAERGFLLKAPEE